MPKLVNLGSLCVDHVYRVPAFTRAGESVASPTHETFPGGKGLNQSIAAARSGVEVVHVGCVGEDGGWLKHMLADEGVDVTDLRMIEGSSGHAVIQVNEAGENAMVFFGGTNWALAEEDIRGAVARVGSDDWLLLQNEINDIELVLREAADRECRVAFNVAPVDGREAGYDLSCVRLLVVNEIEASALAGTDAVSGDWSGVVARLARRAPEAAIALTLGSAGLVYSDRGSGLVRLPAHAVPVVDETAAGDAFVGFLIGSLIRGETMEEAVRMGSAAGALAVTRAGAASSIPTLADVRSLAQAGEALGSRRASAKP